MLSSDGCTLIRKPDHRLADRNGYVRQHFLYYEDYYRCCLLPGVVISHIDGKKQNNDVSNLQAFTKSQFSRMRGLIKSNLPLVKKGASPNWKGGKRLDDKGYVLIWMPNHHRAGTNGYVREHILVMESKVGRYLTPDEVVHHINGIKTDNRPENLELFSNHSKHQKIHYKKRSELDLWFHAIRTLRVGAMKSLKNNQICPRCNSNFAHKTGGRQEGKRMYRCTLCCMRFKENSIGVDNYQDEQGLSGWANRLD